MSDVLNTLLPGFPSFFDLIARRLLIGIRGYVYIFKINGMPSSSLMTSVTDDQLSLHFRQSATEFGIAYKLNVQQRDTLLSSSSDNEYFNIVLQKYIIEQKEAILNRYYSSVIGNTMRKMLKLPTIPINDVNIQYESYENQTVDLWINEVQDNNNRVKITMTPNIMQCSVTIISNEQEHNIIPTFVAFGDDYYYKIYKAIINDSVDDNTILEYIAKLFSMYSISQ